MEADFLRYYSLDARRAFWGSDALGVRRLESLVNSLPHDSALARSVDPIYAGKDWDTKTELLAVIAELIDFNSRLYIMAHSKKGAQPPKPIKIPRPGAIEIEAPKISSTDAMSKIWNMGGQVYKEESN